MKINFYNLSKKERGELDSLEKLYKNKKTLKIPIKSLDNQQSFTSSENQVSKISQRSILRAQIIIQGLTTISKIIEQKQDPKSQQHYIDQVIENTHFQDERLLEQYRPLLNSILQKNGIQILKALITTEQQKMAELSKKETVTQNYIAANVNKEDLNHTELLQLIVKELRVKGIPQFNIQREKVIDLLE